MTEDERLNTWRAKILMQTSAKFCEVFALKFTSFLCPQNGSAVFMGVRRKFSTGWQRRRFAYL